MENEIKKLIEKHTYKFLEMCDLYGTASKVAENENIMIKDMESLLVFKQKNCCGKTAENGISKVYERFKHIDVLLSDPVAMNEDKDPIHSTCYDLWKVIKAEAIENG